MDFAFDPLEDINQALEVYSEASPIEVIAYTAPDKPHWLYDFAKDIMGFEEMEPQPHYDMCNLLEKAVGDCQFKGMDQKAYMLLWSRGTFKTTVSCEAVPIGILTKNPNARILITTHKDKTSGRRIEAIKRHLEHNESLHAKYGDDWKPEFRETTWSTKAITVAKRTKVLREPSVEVGSVGSDMTGSHYDLIIADDLIQLENTRNLEQRDKVYEYIMSLFALLDPGGVLILVGTRWHPDDAYGRIIAADLAREKRGAAPLFTKQIRSCYDGPGGLLFPTRLDHDFLREAKDRNSRLFAANYLNQPIDEADKTFKMDCLQMQEFEFYSNSKSGGIIRTPNWQGPVNVTMRWDTAGTKATGKSDFHGLTVVGTDYQNHWWVLDSIGKKGTPSEIIAKVVAMLLHYKPSSLGIESPGAYHHWLDRLQPFVDQYRISTDIFEVKHGGLPKPERIQMLETLWANKMIHLKPDQTTLLGQIDSFSLASLPAHDDELDSLAMHLGGTEAAQDGQVTEVPNPQDPEALKRLAKRGAGNGFRNILIGRRR